MDAEFVLKPNLKKVALLNVLKVTFSVIVILGVLFYLSVLVDLSIFAFAFGISTSELPSLPTLIGIFFVAILVTSIIAVIISVMSVGKKQIMFFSDRLEVYNNFHGFNLDQKVIAYKNISAVNVELNFNDHLMKTGTLVFQLTGTETKSISFEYVDNAEKYLPYVQKLLQNSTANYTADYAFNKKIDDTLNQY